MAKGNKTLIFADKHCKPFNPKNPALSSWEYDMQMYSTKEIHKLIQEHNITKVIDAGDFLDLAFPKDKELELLDYFWSNIPDSVEKICIYGNHTLDRDSSKRVYYEEKMSDFYLKKWNVKVFGYEEIGKDLYCSHKYIDKLQHLTKKYRYIFSHFRSSDGIEIFSDEINTTVLKDSAKKVFLGDIHSQLEYDNIVYTGASSWVTFPRNYVLEEKLSTQPSVIILDEDSGEYTRLNLFKENSLYNKKLRVIKSEEYDNIENIVQELKDEYREFKTFFKVRVYAKKFMLDKIKEYFKDTKDFVLLDFVNLTLTDHSAQKIQFSKLLKESLDKQSVSKSCLDFILRTNQEKHLEELIISKYSTLEGSLNS